LQLMCRPRGRLGVLIALVALALALPATAQAAYPGANGRVAYASNNGGADTEIMSAAYDGTGSTQLTSNADNEKDPAWSADGKKIAYARFGGGDWSLWTMNADGTGQAPLVDEIFSSNPDAADPTWSPDGTKIAFEAYGGIWQTDVSCFNCASQVAATAADERDPAWSPVDPDKILFSQSSGGGDFTLRTVNPGTFTQAPLLSIATHDLTQPTWSPDGTKIAYTYDVSATDHDIYTADADGSNQSGIAATASDERNAGFAPENNMLAYDLLSGDDEIAIRDTPSGSQTIMETRAATADTNPDWQPITTAQVRPLGATPVYVSLVPAFKSCTTPNATHDPPLVVAVCAPPVEASSDLTVGEPLVNGKPSKFRGSVRIRSLPGDLQFQASATDVRCARILASCTGGPLSDYTGNLVLRYHTHVIDRLVAGGTTAGASGPLPIGVAVVACTATVDPTVGSTCSVTTTANSVFGAGSVVAGKRAIWTADNITLEDSNLVPFVTQGNFIP
jgi:WD40-like Beta Propeller Repeat